MAPALTGVAVVAAQAAAGADEPEDTASLADADANAPQDAASLASPVASPSVPASDMASAPAVASPASTVAAFASQVVKRLDQRTSRFDVTLDPAGLGRVSVAMEIGGDGALTARLAFERADAAHMLGAHMQELHQALADAGFRLNADAIRFDVAPQSSSAAGGALAGGFDGSSGFQGGDPSSPRGARSFASAEDAAGLPGAPHASGAAVGGLDIRI